MEEDRYGSVLRQSMKRSLERPAEYRRTNVREPQSVRSSVLILFMVAVLAAGIGGFYLLDRFEMGFRVDGAQK